MGTDCQKKDMALAVKYSLELALQINNFWNCVDDKGFETFRAHAVLAVLAEIDIIRAADTISTLKPLMKAIMCVPIIIMRNLSRIMPSTRSAHTETIKAILRALHIGKLKWGSIAK